MTRFVAFVLLLAAVVVGIHMVVEPLYQSMDSGAGSLWDWINWLIALAVILGLVFSYQGKCAADASDGGVTREWVESCFHFFGFVALAMLFFWSWFDMLMEAYSSTEDTTALVWPVIYVAVAILCGSLGWKLWHADGGDE